MGTDATQAVTLARFKGPRRPRYQIVVQEHIRSLHTGRLTNAEDASVVTAADALGDLIELPVGNRENNVIPYADLPAAKSAYQRLMREGAGNVLANVQVPRLNPDTKLRLLGIPPGGNYRDLREALTERYITGHRWGQDNGTGGLLAQALLRLPPPSPSVWAWTLNTKADSVYHYAVPRALSVREFARLQSFPDRFVFTTDPSRGMIDGRHDGGPAHSRYRQVGNAVPRCSPALSPSI